VLGGAYVFPGGKLDAADQHPAVLSRLSQSSDHLHERLAEPQLPPTQAAGLFVAAIREAFEECRILLGQVENGSADLSALQASLSAGQSWTQALQTHALTLQTEALVPWIRWITPKQASVTNKRFDTRFFITQVPADQTARHDEHETTETLWIRPREALVRYWNREMELAPPQIMSLVHLSRHANAQSVLSEAKTRKPPVVQPEPFEQNGIRTICYPGDPRHSMSEPAFPGPSRLMFQNKRFEPEFGLASLLD
jgi:8-oxo-dGTP pyrophosphatase MutT (NUDIX family)